MNMMEMIIVFLRDLEKFGNTLWKGTHLDFIQTLVWCQVYETDIHENGYYFSYGSLHEVHIATWFCVSVK
jgi:hypothetical protein